MFLLCMTAFNMCVFVYGLVCDVLVVYDRALYVIMCVCVACDVLGVYDRVLCGIVYICSCV